MTDTQEKMHGWYSQKQYEHKKKIVLKINNKPCEKVFYLDKNENEVEVTEVTSEKKYTSNFDDVKYMGELKSFSRVSRI
tara:strand:+ start:517 stop:753 length:237 start_codon:yes stop_codon:yes gene_type:complete